MISLTKLMDLIECGEYKVYILRKIKILYFVKFIKSYCQSIYDYDEVEMKVLTLFENYFALLVVKDLYRYFCLYKGEFYE